jgi:hypothetical protein
VQVPYYKDNFDVVHRYEGIKDYKQLKSMIKNNQEGFVVRFNDGTRMKIKGEEYIRLHRLLTNFSNVDIWECLRKGEDISKMLEKVPDEFDNWVKTTIRDLRYEKMRIHEYAGKLYDNYIENLSGPPYEGELPPRKEITEWVMRQEIYLRPILFNMFDNRDSSDYIWGLVRPKYSKPFWNKEN